MEGQQFTANEVSQEMKQRESRLNEIITSAQDYLSDIDSNNVAGEELNLIQQLAATKLPEVLSKLDPNKPFRLHYIAPTGTGKTLTAAMLAEMTQRPTVYLAHSTTGADQAFHELSQHFKTRNGYVLRYPNLAVPQNGNTTQTFAGMVMMIHQLADHYTEIDWSSVGIVFIDEADISSLSTKRAAVIKEITEKYPVIAIGASATELQSSGKDIKDLFPTELVRWSMPESLRDCTEHKIIPQMSFSDIYLDIELPIETENQNNNVDLDASKLRAAMKSKQWHRHLLEHYKQFTAAVEGKSAGKAIDQRKQIFPGLVIFRNNEFVADFIEQATAMGVVALPFTSNQSEAERLKARHAVESGEAHLLVGSKLPGRGFNLPALKVVYNSLVGFSPQEFWQVAGRGMRQDKQRKDKTAHAFNVVPGRIADGRTQRDLTDKIAPLTFGLFFNSKQIKVPGRGTSEQVRRPGSKHRIQTYDITGITVTSSVDQVRDYIKEQFHLDGRINYHVGSLARIYDLIEEHRIGLHASLRKANTPKWRLDQFAKKLDQYLNDAQQGQDVLRFEDFEESDTAKSDPQSDEEELRRTLRSYEISGKQESKLLHEYFELKNSTDEASKKRASEIQNIIVCSYMSLVRSMLQHLYGRDTDTRDLEQDISLEIYDIINKLDTQKGAHILLSVIYAVYKQYTRQIKVQHDVQLDEITHENEPAIEDNPEAQLIENDQIEKIMNIVQRKMDEQQRKVFGLRYKIEMLSGPSNPDDSDDEQEPSFEKIGQRLGVSGARAQSLHHAGIPSIRAEAERLNAITIKFSPSNTEAASMGKGFPTPFEFVQIPDVLTIEMVNRSAELAQKLCGYPIPQVAYGDPFNFLMEINHIPILTIAKELFDLGLIKESAYTRLVTHEEDILYLKLLRLIKMFVKVKGDLSKMREKIARLNEVNIKLKEQATFEDLSTRLDPAGIKDFIVRHLPYNFAEACRRGGCPNIGKLSFEEVSGFLLRSGVWNPGRKKKNKKQVWSGDYADDTLPETFLPALFNYLQRSSRTFFNQLGEEEN